MYKINISSLRVVGDADPYNISQKSSPRCNFLINKRYKIYESGGETPPLR